MADDRRLLTPYRHTPLDPKDVTNWTEIEMHMLPGTPTAAQVVKALDDISARLEREIIIVGERFAQTDENRFKDIESLEKRLRERIEAVHDVEQINAKYHGDLLRELTERVERLEGSGAAGLLTRIAMGLRAVADRLSPAAVTR